MTPDEVRLRDAWLSELWPTCREQPRHVRAEQREEAAIHSALHRERAQRVDTARDAS